LQVTARNTPFAQIRIILIAPSLLLAPSRFKVVIFNRGHDSFRGVTGYLYRA